MTASLALNPAQLWRDHPREALVLATLGLAAAGAIAGTVGASPSLPGFSADPLAAQAAPPAPPPLIVRELAPQDAQSINAEIPLADGPNPAAKPFAWRGADEAAKARALECLTSAVYYEAASEDGDGQRAVAQVVLNRVRHPAFPASVCAVVYQGSTRSTGCQFTFTCDGSLARRPSAWGWDRARKVAAAALSGYVFKPVGHATHYHAEYVVPYWASSLAKNAVVGAHIFYRWAGGWGTPRAFGQRYSGTEPSSAALREAALIAEQQATAEAKAAEAAEALAAIPGAELLPAAAAKDEKRVAIRFNLAARKAASDAAVQQHQPYVEKVDASANLRWSLTGGIVAEQEKPLGKQTEREIYATGSEGGSGGGAAPGSPD